MVRRLVAPTLWLIVALVVGTLAWMTSQGVAAHVAACAVGGFAAGWFVRRLRPAAPEQRSEGPGRLVLPVVASVLVAAVGVGVPWWLAYQSELRDVAWTMPYRSETPTVVGDRVYLRTDSATAGEPSWLEVRDIRSGKHLWSRRFPARAPWSRNLMLGRLQVAEDGSVILKVDSDNGPERVLRLSADGALRWERPTSYVVAATALTTVLETCSLDPSNRCRLEGVGQRGERRWTMTYERDSPAEIWDPEAPSGPDLTLPTVVPVVERPVGRQRVTLVDADTGQRRQRVDDPSGDRMSRVVAQGRYVWALDTGGNRCRWFVLDATRVRSTVPTGPCDRVSSARTLVGDQVFLSREHGSEAGFGWTLDLASATARPMPYATGDLTTPQAALSLDDSDPVAVDPVTGRRLWSLTPSPDVGNDVTVGESVVRVGQDLPSSNNPFSPHTDDNPGRTVELLAPRTGQQLASMSCAGLGDVEALGADWALVTCGNEFRLLTSR